MTRALFVTVASHELYMPVSAWRNSMGPCGHITFNAAGPPNDEAIIACAKGYEPDVIFYIGCHDGAGIPSHLTFRRLRDIAPCVHYQSDVEDEDWWPLLDEYRRLECFDLIVGQTGVKTPQIDMATLIAVDTAAYDDVWNSPKTYICGFSGSGRRDYDPDRDSWDGRAEILHGLGDRLAFRPREAVGSYAGHAKFMKRCVFALNVSYTGSSKRHHVKWRVLEAAFAGCALLEHEASPTKDWFPEELFLSYGSPEDALARLATPATTVQRKARTLYDYAHERYTPEKIYGGIMEALR